MICFGLDSRSKTATKITAKKSGHNEFLLFGVKLMNLDLNFICRGEQLLYFLIYWFFILINFLPMYMQRHKIILNRLLNVLYYPGQRFSFLQMRSSVCFRVFDSIIFLLIALPLPRRKPLSMRGLHLPIFQYSYLT